MLNVRERLQEAWECVDCGREIAAGEVAIVHYSEVETGEEVDSVSCLTCWGDGEVDEVQVV
jgi:hypothetical protein